MAEYITMSFYENFPLKSMRELDLRMFYIILKLIKQ